MKIGQDKLEQLCTEGVITSEQLECIVQRGQDAKHSFLQLMLILSLSLLSLGCFVLGMGLLLGQYWERLGQIGALAASLLLAWAGFFLLQKRQPVIAQGFALAGGGLWWACLLFIDARYSLDWKISEFILLIFAGLALIPFVSRQILMIGVVAALSFALVTASFDDNYIPFYGAVQMGKELSFLMPMLVVLLWWLLAEHWRESNSRFRSYAWVGVPAFLVFLAKAQYYALYDNHVDVGFSLFPYSIIAAVGVALLFAFLRPSSSPQKTWRLLTVSTGLMLGTWYLGFGPEAANIGVAVCAMYAAVLMYCGVTGGHRSWVNYGVFIAVAAMIGLMLRLGGETQIVKLVFIAVAAMIGLMSNILDSLTQSGAVMLLIGLALLPVVGLVEKGRRTLVKAAVKINRNNQSLNSEMSNKPTHRHIILALIIIAQVFFIALLTLKYEREIASAPHIETPGEISHTGISLPYQFYTGEHITRLGHSIWWEALTDDDNREGSSRPRPDEAALPTSINLSDFCNDYKLVRLCAIWTRGENGIWDYRLEAPNSVEAQPRDGEWRFPALLEVQRQARRTYQPIIVKHRSASAAPATRRDDPEKLEYLLKVDPFAYKDTTLPGTPCYFNRHFFSRSTDDSDTISEWQKRHAISDEQLPCTIIFSLRENKPPIAVTAKINGIPIGEALRRMREDSFPVPAP